MRDEVEAEDPREERPQVGGQLGPVRERDEDVAADRDDDDEQPERELGTAARAGDDAWPSWSPASRGAAARPSAATVGASWWSEWSSWSSTWSWSSTSRATSVCRPATYCSAVVARTAWPRRRRRARWSIGSSSRRRVRPLRCSTVGSQPSTPPGTPLKTTTCVAVEADVVRAPRVPADARRPRARDQEQRDERGAARRARGGPAAAAAAAAGLGRRRARRCGNRRAGGGSASTSSASGSSGGVGVDLERRRGRRRAMLSSPPAAFAASTSSSAARCGSGSPRAMRSMSRRAPSSVRPSEQRIDAIAGVDVERVEVDLDSASTPSARVTIARCGCDSACSACRRPSRTSSSTRLWSSVSWRERRRRAGSTRASRRRGRRAAGCRRRRRPRSSSCPCR